MQYSNDPYCFTPKMYVLTRIMRFGLICGNDFVKYVLTKVAKGIQSVDMCT